VERREYGADADARVYILVGVHAFVIFFVFHVFSTGR